MPSDEVRIVLAALAVVLAPLLLAWALVTWAGRRKPGPRRGYRRKRPSPSRGSRPS